MTDLKQNYQNISVEELYRFISDFPALLWRIEIVKARIEFLNGNAIVAPGIDGSLLLKSIEYRNRVLLPEDLHLIDIFIDSVKEGKNAATVFRVKNQNNSISWLKLTGAANQKDPRYYYGYLLNVDDTVSVIKGVLGIDLDLKLMIEDSDNPVFLVEYDSLGLLCANPAAKELFKINETDFRNISFHELYCDVTKQPLNPIFKDLPLTRKWTGKLWFQSSDKKNRITADTVARYLVHRKNRLVRISLQNTETSQPLVTFKARTDSIDMAELAKKLAVIDDINEIMETCLSSHLSSGLYDAILFSDVHVRKNMVIVYGAGSPFSGMKTSETFSYKGTIAEDINRYALDHLLVDDTQDSIKPIDWALFVPRGIRSYFAMPFYSRGVLRTVLILCSTLPGHFAGKTPDEYAEMLKTLNTAVRAWRRHKRN